MMTALHAIAISAAFPDPMLETIKAYRAGQAAFGAIFDTTPPDRETLEMEDALAAATYGPAQDAILCAAPARPKITSVAGVREASHASRDSGVDRGFYGGMLEKARTLLIGRLRAIPGADCRLSCVQINQVFSGKCGLFCGQCHRSKSHTSLHGEKYAPMVARKNRRTKFY